METDWSRVLIYRKKVVFEDKKWSSKKQIIKDNNPPTLHVERTPARVLYTTLVL